MSTVSFQQSTTNNGQIFLKFSSADLPAGTLNFSLKLVYTNGLTQFSAVNYGGTADMNVDAKSDNAGASVTLSGTLTPSSDNFVTFVFNASGKGVFNADIASLTINGATPDFTDPAPMNFDVPLKIETVGVQADASAVGVYNPFTPSFFTTDTVSKAPAHGSVTVTTSQFDYATTLWTYKPAAGFYGLDTFNLNAHRGWDTIEKTMVVNVSPVGTSGNDVFHSSAANYTVDGGAGIDRIDYTGNSGNFSVANNQGVFTVTDTTGAEGSNALTNFERLHFGDTAYALDVGDHQNGGEAYRLYQAAFNRVPDKAGVGFWINALDHGVTLTEVANGFVTSAEYQSIYGTNTSNHDLVQKFYENILHREPEQAGLDFWVGVLDSHSASRAEVLAGISESTENQVGLVGVIGNGFAYTEYHA